MSPSARDPRQGHNALFSGCVITTSTHVQQVIKIKRSFHSHVKITIFKLDVFVSFFLLIQRLIDFQLFQRSICTLRFYLLYLFKPLARISITFMFIRAATSHNSDAFFLLRVLFTCEKKDFIIFISTDKLKEFFKKELSLIIDY